MAWQANREFCPELKIDSRPSKNGKAGSGRVQQPSANYCMAKNLLRKKATMTK